MTEIKMCVLNVQRNLMHHLFYLMCRNPRPETRGTPAGAGELLWGWQHLR